VFLIANMHITIAYLLAASIVFPSAQVVDIMISGRRESCCKADTSGGACLVHVDSSIGALYVSGEVQH
jgi:hypothetical protein